jgi:hypothetical protein
LSYSYLDTYTPPAPVLEIELCAPESSEWYGPYPALVDTGADFSVIPLELLRPLNPPSIRPVILSSQWKDRRQVLIYKIDLRVGEIVLPAIDVAGDPYSGDVLLGRNLLNKLDLRLQGPALQLHLLR